MKKIVAWLLFSSSLFAQGWFWQYPKPQGNTLWDICILNENTAIAVGEQGTIIRTTDGGENWDVDLYVCGLSTTLSSVFFIDSETGYVVGGSGAMLKTTDGGETWTKLDSVTSKGLTSIYFFNADTGWVTGTGSNETGAIVLKTTDGGETWTSELVGLYVRCFNSVYFTNDSTGWVVGDGYWGNEIYKTTDCGETWIQQDIEPVVYGLQDIQFIDENTGFIITCFCDILKTTDGGKTWDHQNLYDKYPDEDYYSSYSVHFVDSLHGWIVGGDYDGYILKTTDGGENWVEEDMDILDHLYEITFSDPLHGWTVGRDGLIYITTNGGEEWVAHRSEQYSFSSIHFIDENTGWVVGDSGIVLHTSDGGENWIKQNEADSILLSSVYAIDAFNVFAVGAVIKGLSIFDRNGVILKTINGGEIWERQTFDTLYGLHSIVFTTDSIGWISGTNSILLKTIDRGTTWHTIDLDGKSAEGKIQFINENIGWVGGTLKTTDGGKNWYSQVIPITSLNSYNFINAEIGWAIGSYNDGLDNILKTIDGGENWIPCGITSPGYNFSIQFISEKTGWISGFDYLNRTSIIINTTDGGYSWIDQKSPCKNEGGLSNIFFINENTGWAVGEGAILKTVDGGGSAVDEVFDEHSNLPVMFRLEQNYPNPFNISTVIPFKLCISGHVNLSIYNLLGRKIQTLVDKNVNVGEFKVIWDAGNAASGIYIYCLQIDNQREMRKMIFTK